MLNRSFYKGRRVLVTGHTGFKGTWLCKLLLRLGAEVCGYALSPQPYQLLYNLSGIENRIQSHFGDIRDEQHIKTVVQSFQPEVIIHLAAQPIVRDSYTKPKYTYETNILGTLYLLEAMRACASVRSFLNVTTEKVYENHEDPDVLIDESFPLNGYDPYSNSKSCSEFITQTYRRCFFSQSECRISTARTSNALGGGDFSPHRIISDCVSSAAAGKPIIVRNPASVRPYQYVLDPLLVYLEICESQYSDMCFEGSYNVAPDYGISTQELVTKFCEHWGDGLTWEVKQDAGPYEASMLKVSNRKLKQTFGWTQKCSVDEMMRRIVMWEKTYICHPEKIAEHMDREIEDFLGLEKNNET